MNSGKRLRSFSVREKLKIIREAEEIGNRAAGRKFDVPESCIRDWRKKKDTLLSSNSEKRAFRGKSAKYPGIEEQLSAYIRDRRQLGFALSTEMCQMKALQIARELGVTFNEFKASRGWMLRFFNRNGLSIRRKTTISQRLPEAYEENLVRFQRYVINLRKTYSYLLGQIGNADQTPVYFEMPYDTTVNEAGAKTVQVRTAGAEKQRCTVMLAVLADGKKLPPYIIFKRKTLPKNVKFPSGIVVRSQEKGWMNNDLVLDWIKCVWERRPGALLQLRSMLLLDSFRGHLTDDVKKRLKDGKTDQVIIPGGMTSMLQPLDVCINRPFKSHMKRLYSEWMASAVHETTPTGRIKKAGLVQICQWIITSWNLIKEDLVVRSFKKCCISNKYDGSEDSMVCDSGEDEESSASEDCSTDEN